MFYGVFSAVDEVSVLLGCDAASQDISDIASHPRTDTSL
jgi:hypothetical protein